MKKERQRDAKLATAMGWTQIEECAGYADLMGVRPDGRRELVPRFDSETAKSALLHWLSLDRSRWSDFYWTLFNQLGFEKNIPLAITGIARLMLASPSTIAEAAMKSLGLEED